MVLEKDPSMSNIIHSLKNLVNTNDSYNHLFVCFNFPVDLIPAPLPVGMLKRVEMSCLHIESIAF